MLLDIKKVNILNYMYLDIIYINIMLLYAFKYN